MTRSRFCEDRPLGCKVETPACASCTRIAYPPTPRVETSRAYTTVFTDGSSTGRWGVGGWAWAVAGEDDQPTGQEGSGGHPWTTNQQMELLAAHQALLALPGLLLIVSDSQYVVRCFTEEWWRGWERKEWRKVSNVDLWQAFLADWHQRAGEVRFAWVPGHSKHPMNDHVDALAKAAKSAVEPVVQPASDLALIPSGIR